MPTTPKGFPYPAATAPVSLGASDIQALATAVDAVGLRKVAFGATSANFSLGSAVTTTITHGMGLTPTVVVAVFGKHPSGAYAITAMIDAIGPTTFQVVGIPNASISPAGPAALYWVAFA